MDQTVFTEQSFAVEIRKIMLIKRTNIMDALMLFMAEYDYNEHDVNHWITPEIKEELELHAKGLHLI